MQKSNLLKEFFRIFGHQENSPKIFFSPGRVNLIGEHTDYNGGFVLPCALSFGTYLVIRKTNDDNVKFTSANFELKKNVSLKNLKDKINGEWVNFPLGIIDQFSKSGKDISGLEFYYSGNIPNEAGLSSSASIELVTAFALNILFAFDYSIIDLIMLSQKCEHEFIGVKCGIMDQFAVGMGKKDHALFLNCKTMKHIPVQFKIDGYKLIISNTNLKRGLSASKYNERVSECGQAVNDISKVMEINDLSDLSIELFNEVKDEIKNNVVKQRAMHVVYENNRVLKAVKALEQNHLGAFGKLMIESHDSLRDKYEVTGFELDTLVEEALKIKGVIGSRMTGAGFGGCTVSIVKEEFVDKFQNKVGEGYFKKTKLKPDFYLPEIGDGVREI